MSYMRKHRMGQSLTWVIVVGFIGISQARAEFQSGAVFGGIGFLGGWAYLEGTHHVLIPRASAWVVRRVLDQKVIVGTLIEGTVGWRLSGDQDRGWDLRAGGIGGASLLGGGRAEWAAGPGLGLSGRGILSQVRNISWDLDTRLWAFGEGPALALRWTGWKPVSTRWLVGVGAITLVGIAWNLQGGVDIPVGISVSLRRHYHAEPR